jgi:3-oxoacyl-[acyl-carrier protein] reductase
MGRLDGKVALVVGAGAGLGMGIALGFAKEGALVCVADLAADRANETLCEIKTAEGVGVAICADISRLSDIHTMVGEAARHSGRIDILVNSAGLVLNPTIAETREEDWDAVMNVHLKGVFFTIQAVLPLMQRQGSGRIINLASVLGTRGRAGSCVYCAAKAGIINLTRALAVELGGQNICVNAIAPGFTITPGTERVLSDEELVRTFVSAVPLGRLGTVSGVAAAAMYLASDDAGSVTGTTLFVDGGETAK